MKKEHILLDFDELVVFAGEPGIFSFSLYPAPHLNAS